LRVKAAALGVSASAFFKQISPNSVWQQSKRFKSSPRELLIHCLLNTIGNWLKPTERSIIGTSDSSSVTNDRSIPAPTRQAAPHQTVSGSDADRQIYCAV
jgi:hypothetical protein